MTATIIAFNAGSSSFIKAISTEITIVVNITIAGAMTHGILSAMSKKSSMLWDPCHSSVFEYSLNVWSLTLPSSPLQAIFLEYGYFSALRGNWVSFQLADFRISVFLRCNFRCDFLFELQLSERTISRNGWIRPANYICTTSCMSRFNRYNIWRTHTFMPILKWKTRIDEKKWILDFCLYFWKWFC